LLSCLYQAGSKFLLIHRSSRFLKKAGAMLNLFERCRTDQKSLKGIFKKGQFRKYKQIIKVEATFRNKYYFCV